MWGADAPNQVVPNRPKEGLCGGITCAKGRCSSLPNSASVWHSSAAERSDGVSLSSEAHAVPICCEAEWKITHTARHFEEKRWQVS